MQTQTTFAISVGNTRIQSGVLSHDVLSEVSSTPVASIDALMEKTTGWWSNGGKDKGASVLLASVNSEVSETIDSLVRDLLGADVYVLERDIPVPIGRSLDPETIVGVDRLLSAAAAWDHIKLVLVVVDAGTAISVVFVDGEGVFHGGAIMPGAVMQLESLARGAELLDPVEFSVPDEDAFGRSTASAMLRGVYHGIRGGAWRLIELYAESYGAYPTVIATGGDAEALFGNDELITSIVPDLALKGIAVAARTASATEDERDS